MNLIDAKNFELTMTSIELVQFINKDRESRATTPGQYVALRHDSFMNKVHVVLGAEGVHNFVDTHQNTQNGQTYKIYRFPKREACLMAMSYSYELQAKVFDHMTELEAMLKPALPNFADPVAAARAWADEVEAKQAAQAQLAAAAPKIEFAEAVRNVDGLCSLEKIAKTLGWGRNRFIAQLKKSGVLQESRMPYQKYIERKYFEVVEQHPWEDSKGVSHPSFTTMVTGAGQVWLSRHFHDGVAAPTAPVKAVPAHH